MSLGQPTLPEALLVEDVAVAAVGIVAHFVPGGDALFAVVSDAVDVVKKDAPPIEAALAKLLDGETITLANEAADLAEDVKFGPDK